MPTIKQRGETYKITVSLGYDSTGAQIRKHTTYTPDKSLTPNQIKKELDRQAVLFEDKCKKGLYLDGDITFAEFAEKWFIDHAEKQLKEKTVRSYRILLKRTNAAIGHIKLSKLQPHHLTQFYNNLKENGVRGDTKYKSIVDFKMLMDNRKLSKVKLINKSGVSEGAIYSIVKGGNVTYDTAIKICDCLKLNINKTFAAVDNKTLSDNTVHHYHTFVSSVLATAVIWQVILSNPCERVKPPKVIKREAKYLNEQELEMLLEALDNLSDDYDQHKLMIKILLFTGLRKGELCGLKFEDVDFDSRTINIKRTLLYTPEKGVYVDTPKTESSNRSIFRYPVI